MTLTINPGLLRHLAGTARCPVYVQIDTQDASGVRTIKMVSSGQAIDDGAGLILPRVVSTVRPAGYALDPVTREPTIGQMSIEVSDSGAGSWWREIRKACYLKGSRITVKLGHPDINLAAWCGYWSGVVEETVPGIGHQTIVATGGLRHTRRAMRAGLWANKHHFELAEDILDWAGIPVSMREAASFDYDNDLTISHLVARRTEVSWDGGEWRDITPAGAIDDSRVSGWAISGVCDGNSNQGRLYPEVIVASFASGHTIAVGLYSDTGGTELVGFGCREVPAVNGTYTVEIGPPLIKDTSGNSNPRQMGVTGIVAIAYTQSTFTIAQASTSYIEGDGATYGEEMSALAAVQGLARQLNASVVEREDGKMEMVRFDASAAAVDHWTRDDIGDTFEVHSIDKNMINEVRINTKYMGPSRTEVKEMSRMFVNKRATSQGRYSLDGGTTPGVYDLPVDNSWGNAVACLTAAITDSSVTVVIGNLDIGEHYYGGTIRNYGMTGTAGVSAGPAQDAKRRINGTAGRYGYFRIGDEIIRAETSTVTAVGNTIEVYDPQADADVTRYQNMTISLGNCLRGRLDTSASAHKLGALVYDVTSAVLLSDPILDRFEHGAPVVSCWTALRKIEHQVGEFVTIDDAIVSGVGVDGVDSGDKWEITKKEIDPLGDLPGIFWELVKVAPAATTSSGYSDRENVGYLPISQAGLGAAIDMAGMGSMMSTQVDHDETAHMEADEHYDWSANVSGISVHDDNIAATSIKQHEEVIGTVNLTDDTMIGRTGIKNHDFGSTTKAIATTPPDNWAKVLGSWGASSDIYVDTSEKLSGKHSVHFRATATANASLALSYTPVVAGKLYSIGADVWGDSANAGDKGKIIISWYTSALVHISNTTLFDKQITGSAWKAEGPVFAIAPATARYMKITLQKVTT